MKWIEETVNRKSMVKSLYITPSSKTADKHHMKLTEHHAIIKRISSELMSGKALEKKRYADEIGYNLETAKKQHAILKTRQPEEDKIISAPYHKSIEKHHIIAAQHLAALKEEVSRSMPANMAIVMELAEFVFYEIEDAESQHNEMKIKTNKINKQ